MNHLWRHKRAFMKDLLESYPEPRPAPTTVATLLKRMRDKGYVDFTTYGKSREYFPLVEKTAYFATHVKGLINKFFNGSPSQFASFFAEETSLSQDELKELKGIIDAKIKND